MPIPVSGAWTCGTNVSGTGVALSDCDRESPATPMISRVTFGGSQPIRSRNHIFIAH